MIAPQEHEYSIMGGANRANVGRMLSLAASSISAGLVFIVLSLVNLAEKLGWNVNLPPMLMSLLGAGMVFTVLYWVLDRWLWKLSWVGKYLKVPDLSGTWTCEGKTYPTDDSQEVYWKGTVTIVQSWDKLRIHLRTETSYSDSIAAAMAYDSVDGYVVLYHYANFPLPPLTELKHHKGCCFLTVGKDLKSAVGEYFNGQGRTSSGTMTWTKTDQ